MVVVLKVGELQIRAQVRNHKVERSPFTGRDLSQLEVTFDADRDHQDQIDAARQLPAFVLEENTQELPEPRPVAVYQKEYSFTNNSRKQVYTWVLTDKESLPLESLHVADMIFGPYQYEESIDKDALIITARIEADKSVRESMRKLPQYFPVIRKGLSDEARSMRRGKMLWSHLGEDKVKIQLVLVEEAYDQHPSKPLRFLEPQFSNVREALAMSNDRISNLVDLLEKKGSITKEEADGIFEISEEKLIERQESFDCVSDLDEWLADD